MTRLFKLLNSRWYLFLGFLTAFIYFRVAPLQVDPHHDGVILGAAVAVAEGRPIQSGAFSQYGPASSHSGLNSLVVQHTITDTSFNDRRSMLNYWLRDLQTREFIYQRAIIEVATLFLASN